MSACNQAPAIGDLSRPAPPGRFRVAVVGGGAAGTLLALHLQPFPHIEVVLYDRSAAFARGVAYSARAPWHCLNVPAIKMGGWHADDAAGFATWLHQRLDEPPHDSEHRFAERSLYGEWLASLLAPLVAQGTVLPVAREVVDVAPNGEGAMLVLDDHSRHAANAVVLCLGNATVRALPCVPAHPRHIPQVWQPDALEHIPPDDAVLVVGSGASAMDAVLELLHRDHRGTVCMLSRRGLLPQPEALGTPYPDFLSPAHGSTLRGGLRQVRSETARAQAAGLHWQNVMDAVLRQADTLWAGLSLREQRQFLRHVRPFWMVLRHRANPEILARLDASERAGQLQRIAGRLVAAQALGGDGTGFSVAVRTRAGVDLAFETQWVLNATGPEELTHRQTDLLTANLLRRGLARPGPFGLGLAVSQDGQVLGTLPSLFALGLPTRGTFWEVTSVPALRGRAAPLAQGLGALAAPVALAALSEPQAPTAAQAD